MNRFEMQILDGALSLVESATDSLTLANMVTKLIKQGQSNYVLDHMDTQLLALLINHERKTSQFPSFSNIYSLLASHNLERLTRIPGWKQFTAHSSARLRNSCLAFMEMRLSPFKCLRAA